MALRDSKSFVHGKSVASLNDWIIDKSEGLSRPLWATFLWVFDGGRAWLAWVFPGGRAESNKTVGFGSPAHRIFELFSPMKLEDQLRGAIRLKQYSLRTEETYVGWYRRVDGALPRHPLG